MRCSAVQAVTRLRRILERSLSIHSAVRQLPSPVMTSQNTLARFSHTLWLSVGLVVLLAISFAFYVRSEKRLDRANSLRLLSFRLAGELRQSSDDLTRKARRYAITGDPVYKQQYQDVLDIRDGTKPRPEEYWRFYWDLPGGAAPRPESPGAIALLDLMRQAGFTEYEFQKLAEAKANSDALSIAEFEAMKLVDSTGPQAGAEAIRMLHDARYDRDKAAIMKPIDEFSVLVDARTRAAVQNAATHALALRFVFMTIGLGLIFMLWRAYAVMRDTLGGSVDEVYEHITRIGSGDFSVAIPVQAGRENSVLGWLSATRVQLDANARESKRGEAALRESEEKFRQMADNITDAFWIRSADMREVHYLSPGFERIWGRSRESLYANPEQWTEFILPADRERVQGAFATLLGEAASLDLEYRIVRPDGGQRWIRARGFQVRDTAGQLIRHTGIVSDITERKLAELKLSDSKRQIEQLNADLEMRVARRTEALSVATAEAERANQAKSEFLSRMSHELRTPMNAILGFAQLLETEDNLTADHRESVDQILRGGGHLLELINEVLDISSIESGRLTLSSEPIALAGLLEETISLLRPLSAKLQIQIAVLASESAGGHVQADRQRLKQVLLNLLGNALKYNRPGGSVTVRYAAVGGSHAATRLSVTDTGAGLSAVKLARLFNPFDRLGAEQTHVEGTGLGLVLARRIVEHMGGTLGVESVVGEGSTFWIELPTAEPPLEQEATASDLDQVSDPEASAEARVILYIEDNPSNVLLVTRILARRPAIRLLCAETGTDGLKMAREHRPDLILLDLHLPDCPGQDVLTRLAVDPRTEAIPVVMLTADAVAGKREAMLASGARAFLTKPLDVRSFLGVVDRFLAVEPSFLGSRSGKTRGGYLYPQ